VFGDVVMVSDFGLGKQLVDEGTVGLTKTNQWAGTEPYMASEQWTAMKQTGPAADVFALGKTSATSGNGSGNGDSQHHTRRGSSSAGGPP
jgi:hypothetical protein